MEWHKQIGITLEIDRPYPHHQAVFAGIQRYAREVGGWRLVLDEHPTYELKRRGFDQQPYDGVIARAQPKLKQRLQRLGIPLVNTLYQQHAADVAGVYHDPIQIGRIAAEHLIHRGFKRVAVMGDQSHKHALEATKAFVELVSTEGLACDEMYMIGEDNSDLAFYVRFEEKVKQWLSRLRPPVGLFFTSAFDARMVTQFCYAMDLHVPYDVSIVCQHDLKSIVEVSPQITTIMDNYEHVGYEAAALLDRLMDGKPIPKEPIMIPPRGIKARESTDSFAVEDELVTQGLQYMSQHMRNKISVDDIAYELAVSSRLLQMRFNQALGRGVSQELRRLRLSAVKVKLAEPELTIEKIAHDTGFASADTLSHVFKRELGLTPAAYRKSLG